MHKLLMTLLMLTFITPAIHFAQFGGLKDKVIKRTKQKFEKKVEDKIVEALSEELARMAFRPINSAMDSMLRSSYEEEQGGNVDWDKAGESYGEFLNNLNKAANVPEAYHFNVIVEAEIKDYEKEKHKVIMLYSTDNKYMGIEQENDGTKTLIVIDNEQDIMVMYTDQDGNRSAQALPSMMKFSNSFVNQQNVETNVNYNMTFTKLDKTKEIAGYESEGYKFESEEEKGDAWVALEFPVSFFEMFGNAYAQFMPKTYSETFNGTNGMIMESEYQNKKDKKIKSSYKVKKVKLEDRKINNSEWGLGAS